jgi:hypothetical protein
VRGKVSEDGTGLTNVSYERTGHQHFAEWVEDQHPRDERGRFGSGGKGYGDEPTLTPEQHEVLGYYCSSDYHGINSLLRTGVAKDDEGYPMEPEYTKTAQGYIAALTAAMDDNPNEAVVVHRGVEMAVLKDVGVGDVLTDKGFMSTSFHPKVADDFAMIHETDGAVLTFAVPANHSGIPTGTNGTDDEQEFVMRPGTSLRVDAIVPPYSAGPKEFPQGNPYSHPRYFCTVVKGEQLAEWNEDDHPRDERGRFGSKGAATGLTPRKEPEDWTKLRSKLMRAKNESCYAYGADGKLLATASDNDSHRVDLLPIKAEAEVAAIMVHNHPDNSSFSINDVAGAWNFDVPNERVMGSAGTQYDIMLNGVESWRDVTYTNTFGQTSWGTCNTMSPTR